MPTRPTFSSGRPPGGPYSPAVIANGLVFFAGKVGVVPGEDNDIATQTRRILGDFSAALADLGLDWSDVVKTTIFLTDIDDFAAVNEVYADHIGPIRPARSTVQVAGLPAGAGIEIELIAAER